MKPLLLCIHGHDNTAAVCPDCRREFEAAKTDAIRRACGCADKDARISELEAALRIAARELEMCVFAYVPEGTRADSEYTKSVTAARAVLEREGCK